MKGSDLKNLGQVANLAKLDLEAAALTLEQRHGKLRATYGGTYAAGYRTLKASIADFKASVSAQKFKAIADMAAESDLVSIEYDGSLNVRFGQRGARSYARLVPYGQLADSPVRKIQASASALIAPSALLTEIEAAGHFRAESYIRQSLTGIRLEFSEDSIRILAYDGFAALFESRLNAVTKGAGIVVVPYEDFLVGLRLMESDARISFDRAAILLSYPLAFFRSSVYEDDWPEFGRITEVADYTAKFEIEAAAIKNLVSSSKLFAADPAIHVAPKGDYVTFSTGSEIGSFSTRIKGKIPQPFLLDRDLLGKASALGLNLTVNVSSELNKPIMIESDHRRCWIALRQ